MVLLGMSIAFQQDLQKTSIPYKLGEKIRALRAQQSYSQEDFAAVVNLNRTYIGGIEHGKRNLATLNLIRIAKFLKVKNGK